MEYQRRSKLERGLSEAPGRTARKTLGVPLRIRSRTARTPTFVWGTVSDGTKTVPAELRNYILGSGLR